MEVKSGVRVIWLSLTTDPPKMDQEVFLFCGSGSSPLPFADGKENFPGHFFKGGGGVVNCEWFDERGESRPASTCCCLRRTGQENAQPPGRHPLQLCLFISCDAGIAGFKGLYPFVPKGRRDQRPVQDALCSARLLWLSKGPALGLSFSLSPFRWPSCMVAKVASSGDPGMEPRAGGPCQGTRLGTLRTAGFSTVLVAVSPVSCSATWLVWGCFSVQLNLYLGLGWKAVFLPCSSLSLASGRARPGSDACLLCGLG